VFEKPEVVLCDRRLLAAGFKQRCAQGGISEDSDVAEMGHVTVLRSFLVQQSNARFRGSQ
jgi:hypothetical protein